MRGRVCVVTGANRGIGLETARGLAARGATVVMTARDMTAGAAALADVRASTGNPNLSLLRLDLSKMDDVRRAAEELAQAQPKIDVLVNNAGLILSERHETSDGFEATFAINHLGPYLFTRLLAPAIHAGDRPRVVNLASTAHRGQRLDMADLQSTGQYRSMSVYGKSKLCNILFTRELARRWRSHGVDVHAVHPGVVRSGFGRDGDTKGFFAWLIRAGAPFLTSPEKGARTSIWCATSPDLQGLSGGYYARCKESSPSRAAQDDAVAQQLWDVSAQLVGLAR